MPRVITRPRRRSTKIGHAFFYWGPLAVWLGLSLLMATAFGGYDGTVSGIYRALAFVAPSTVSPDINRLYGVVHVVRRGAYIVEYGILTALLARAVQAGKPDLKRGSVFAITGSGLLFALLDNAVRGATPGRHGGWDDIVLSLVNVAIVTAGIYGFFAVKSWERAHFAGGTDSGTDAIQ